MRREGQGAKTWSRTVTHTEEADRQTGGQITENSQSPFPLAQVSSKP